MSNALIVKLGAIGDIVMALPAVSELHKSGMRIDWVCGRAVQPLLECYSWITLIPVDDRAMLQGALGKKLAGTAGLWRILAGTRYDMCATLYYDKRYELLTLPVRADRRITLSRSSRKDMLIPGRSHAQEYARILLDKQDTCNAHRLLPVPPDRLPATRQLPETRKTRIALVPGGASNMLRQQTLRRWPVEHYVSLAKTWHARGWEVVLLGGPDDAWVRPYFQGEEVIDCIGSLSLPEVIAVCNTCVAVVSHDTGPLHLAGLSRAAIVGLFGPTDPACFLPQRERAVALWGGESLACRPCYDGRDFARCDSNICMQQISKQSVLDTVDRLIV